MLPFKAVIGTAHKTPEGVVSLESDPTTPYRVQNMTVPPTQLKSVLTSLIVSTVCWLMGSLLLAKSSVPFPHSFLYAEGWLTFLSHAHPTVPACCGPSKDSFLSSTDSPVLPAACHHPMRCTTEDWSYEADDQCESCH